MCGILGIISDPSARQLDDNQVIAMRDTMTARGPDGAGMFRDETAALAHRRLAIRDIDGGNQPWVTQNQRFVLVFNGEIYNDREIGEELQLAGIRLRTSCDTEVLAEAWSAWGPDCLDRLRGMFAFGVYDRRSKETWIVRDRCGIKPLFYAQIGREFVFASSIAAIRRHPGFSSQPNFAAIGHYFQTLRTTLDHQTVFKDIYSVRPAEAIQLVGNNRLHRTYWELPSPSNELADEITYDEAVGELERCLETSVSLRLRSDVPVGMMMSGGVDSNTLATLVQRQSGGGTTGCCGGGTDNETSEQGSDFEYAENCASEVGVNLSQVRVSDESYLETCETLIDLYETPISTPTDAIIYQIARRLKQDVGVAIGGEGADEAFCGYSIPHWSGNDFDLSRGHYRNEEAASSIQASLHRQYGRTTFTSPADHYLSTNSLVPASTQQSLFNPAVWQSVHADGAVNQYYESLFAECPKRPMTERYARVLFRTNLESLLGRLDSATMATSLEARVPFTDHHVVEQAFKTPHHFKIDICPSETKPWLSSMELNQRGSLRSKRILRSVASRMMPRRLAVRPKMSFPTPLPKWLDQKWNAWIENRISKSPFAKELFRTEAMGEISRLPSALAMWKWPILNTVMWGDRYFA